MGIVGKGFAAVRKAKVKADLDRASYAGMRVRDFMLRDGEEAVGYFNGTNEEPILGDYHTVMLGPNKWRRWLGARGFEGHDGCVCCWAWKNKDKRVGKPTTNAVWNFVDARWIHKRLDKEATAETGFERFKFFPCTGDLDDEEPSEDCKYCQKGVKRVRQGQCKARFSMTWANGLTGLNEKLARRCLACRGKIKIVGYENEEGKEVPDLDDVDDPAEWKPQYECSKCDNPDPGSIFRYPISIQRNGAQKATSYNFSTPQDAEADNIPDWVSELEPINLEETLRP